MNTIQFFKEDIHLRMMHREKLKKWIHSVIKQNKRKTGYLNFVFCSDRYLLKINKQYLNHSTYTDIITFNTSESANEISGDIFISVTRIKENTVQFSTSFKDELHRVMIHGVLHLLGYNDKSEKEKNAMRMKENECLAFRRF
jgi:rRNA maturation RNase YbeY